MRHRFCLTPNSEIIFIPLIVILIKTNSTFIFFNPIKSLFTFRCRVKKTLPILIIACMCSDLNLFFIDISTCLYNRNIPKYHIWVLFMLLTKKVSDQKCNLIFRFHEIDRIFFLHNSFLS